MKYNKYIEVADNLLKQHNDDIYNSYIDGLHYFEYRGIQHRAIKISFKDKDIFVTRVGKYKSDDNYNVLLNIII
jgi:hypothetical protein